MNRKQDIQVGLDAPHIEGQQSIFDELDRDEKDEVDEEQLLADVVRGLVKDRLKGRTE